MDYPDTDFRIEWFSGSGAGGQHRNKHANSCRLIHIPTGLKQESQCRKRQNSYEEARKSLLTLLSAKDSQSDESDKNNRRKGQIGSGMRADKIRTYRYQDDKVTNHLTGKTARLKKVLNGNIDII
mgnify:CR=1 FL=1